PLPLRPAGSRNGAGNRSRRRLRSLQPRRDNARRGRAQDPRQPRRHTPDGTLAFQLQRLAELPLAAVVVEARYAALFKLEHVDGNWLADQLARLEVRYPEVHLVFADSRLYAEDWTYRFLTTALADATDPNR